MMSAPIGTVGEHRMHGDQPRAVQKNHERGKGETSARKNRAGD